MTAFYDRDAALSSPHRRIRCGGAERAKALWGQVSRRAARVSKSRVPVPTLRWRRGRNLSVAHFPNNNHLLRERGMPEKKLDAIDQLIEEWGKLVGRVLTSEDFRARGPGI